MAQTQITLSITGKIVLTIAPLEWVVAIHIIFYRNKEEEKCLKLSDYLNQLQGIIAILKALQGLASMCFTSWTPTAKTTQLYKMYLWSLYSQMLMLCLTPKTGH